MSRIISFAIAFWLLASVCVLAGCCSCQPKPPVSWSPPRDDLEPSKPTFGGWRSTFGDGHAL